MKVFKRRRVSLEEYGNSLLVVLRFCYGVLGVSVGALVVFFAGVALKSDVLLTVFSYLVFFCQVALIALALVASWMFTRPLKPWRSTWE